MASQITCECGYVVRGESPDEVVRGVREHMRTEHPDLDGKVSDDDLHAWVEEV